MLMTCAAFWPSLRNGFLDWDDHVTLVDNVEYRGLGWAQLRWMLTTVRTGHYIPLTWLTFGLDYVMWGMNPAGYHLTSLLLHAASAGLFFGIARRLLRVAAALDGAALTVAAAVAALFFAIHPLRVESVAWATERRDVLSGVFFFGTILTYLEASEAHGSRRRWLLAASVSSYLLALLSKSIVLTLPAVLVLLDVYPLRRLPAGTGEWVRGPARRVWAEKLPYLLLALPGAVVAYHAQAAGGGIPSLAEHAWDARVGTAAFALGFYVYKTVFPHGLSPLYEAPQRIGLLEARFLFSILAVPFVTVALFLLRRRWPAGLALWAYYALVLAPVSGLVHGGFQLVADRYSYLAGLAWALLAGAAVGSAVDRASRGTLRPSLARLAVGTAAAWVLVLGVLTWHQVQIWRDSGRLWGHAIAVAPDCFVCRINFGESLMAAALPGPALAHFERALALRPDRMRAHLDAAQALESLGQFPEAVKRYRIVLASVPDAVLVRVNLATALVQTGRRAEAVQELRRALDASHPVRAAAYFKRAVEADPSAAIPRAALFQLHMEAGRRDLAREQYDVLRAVDPALAGLLGRQFEP